MSVDAHPCLPLPVPGVCGYCGRQLILQPAGDSACAHCGPLLAEVGTLEEWAAFHQAARSGVFSPRRGDAQVAIPAALMPAFRRWLGMHGLMTDRLSVNSDGTPVFNLSPDLEGDTDATH